MKHLKEFVKSVPDYRRTDKGNYKYNLEDILLLLVILGRLGKCITRPVSLLSVLCIVVGVLTVVIFGVVPQLVNTFGNLGQSITQFIPHAQAWGKEVFHGNKEVVELINSVQFDWDKIVETLIDFLNNGAGNMLSSTLTLSAEFQHLS